MTTESAPDDRSTLHAPWLDGEGKPLPHNIGSVLTLLHVLMVYGLHLADTLQFRAVARGFSTIAQWFGTASADVILARLMRGVLRASALDQVLRARAARGRDLMIQQPREPGRRKQPVPPAEGQTPAPPKQRRRPQGDTPPDTDTLPSLEQLLAEVRRRPVGQTIADICRDLGIAPELCNGQLWNAVYFNIIWYRGSHHRLFKDFQRRLAAFEPELGRAPNLTIPARTREATRDVLGFFIGERPVLPDWLVIDPALLQPAPTHPP